MASSKKLVTITLFGSLAFSLFLLGAAVPMRAQTSSRSIGDGYSPETKALKPWLASDSSDVTDQPTIADPSAEVPPQAKASTTSEDDAWHFAVSPYLWFPGVHGVMSGPNGNGLGFSASPGDLLSHFRFGLMGAVEARHKRFITSVDMMWIRLGDDSAIPFPPLNAISANMHATEFLLTPKIGFRVIDSEKIKIDATTGLRYWHLGESLNFNPSALGLNFNGSQNFVDPLVGGRIQVPLSPKIAVTILGDVGGWNTGSKLEYQVGGVLGYRIKPAVSLEAGYRYLNLDYSTKRDGVFNITTAGVIFGVVINLK